MKQSTMLAMNVGDKHKRKIWVGVVEGEPA